MSTTLPPTAIAPAADQPMDEATFALFVRAQLDKVPAVIDSQEAYQLGMASLPMLKTTEDRIINYWKEDKSNAHKTHAGICQKESAQLTPVKTTREALSTSLYQWEQKLEEERRAEELRQAEARRKDIESAVIEEAAAISKIDPELAEQVIEQAIASPPPVVALPSMAVSVAGVGGRAKWTFDYAGCATGVAWDDLPGEDRERLLKTIPAQYIMSVPNVKLIEVIVKQNKSATSIPGIVARDAGKMSTRSKR